MTDNEDTRSKSISVTPEQSGFPLRLYDRFVYAFGALVHGVVPTGPDYDGVSKDEALDAGADFLLSLNEHLGTQAVSTEPATPASLDPLTFRSHLSARFNVDRHLSPEHQEYAIAHAVGILAELTGQDDRPAASERGEICLACRIEDGVISCQGGFRCGAPSPAVSEQPRQIPMTDDHACIQCGYTDGHKYNCGFRAGSPWATEDRPTATEDTIEQAARVLHEDDWPGIDWDDNQMRQVTYRLRAQALASSGLLADDTDRRRIEAGQ